MAARLTSSLALDLLKPEGCGACGFSAVWALAILAQMAPFKAVIALPGLNYLSFSFWRPVGLCCFIPCAFALAVAHGLALALALLAFAFASFSIDGIQGVTVGSVDLRNGS